MDNQLMQMAQAKQQMAMIDACQEKILTSFGRENDLTSTEKTQFSNCIEKYARVLQGMATSMGQQ